ncbi:MAG: RsmB/NOP family class I SAM-dependent RNA methyltransferase [Promethearchaeota archaeon]|nr:MAG: RsmB/NOP family class I SAM-dependent RNA methyltransferase [Candidatus Lokiarchaeota archaeon]
MSGFEIKKEDIQIITELVSRFINRSTSPLPLNLRKNIAITHYYTEIIRFWNKLNYIIRRILKSSYPIDSDRLSSFLYVTYRILWENASEKELSKEIEGLDKKFLVKVNNFSLSKSIRYKNEKEKLSILEAIPSFMIDHLLPVMSIDYIKDNVKFMNGTENRIEITLRINNLQKNLVYEDLLEQIKENFNKNKVVYRRDSDIPELFWIPISQKNRVIRSSFYQRGYLIFQDKASAIAIHLLSPQKNDKICDMCAAPGIKTNLIAQFMNNKGNILGGEFLLERAKIMKNLLKQLNVLNTHIINTDSIIFPIRYQNYFDLILLDAPCTGSGTFLRNPELKWRQNEKFLQQNLTLQKKLLDSALKLLKPKGILLYCTCSLYPEEGEYQILNYLDRFDPLDLPDWISPSYKIENRTIPGTGRLFPSIHHTQGFFIGKFKKRE